ncbi:MAG: hypothetical protein AVDCRST_MAG01-01-5322, partial [uncultured Rubrobacteraceae bacterium]
GSHRQERRQDDAHRPRDGRG